MEGEIEEHLQVIEQIKETKGIFEAKSAKLEVELKVSNDRVDLLEERYKSLQEKVADAQKEIAKAIGEKSSLADKVEKRDTDLEQQKRIISEQETQIKKLKAELREARDKNGILQERIITVEKKLTEEKSRIASRIAHEAEQEVRILQNRIEAHLISNYSLYQKLKTSAMTKRCRRNHESAIKGRF